MKNKAFGFYTAALTLILTVATLVAVLIYGSKGGVVNSLVPIALGAAAVCEVSLLFGEKVWTDFTGIIAATLLTSIAYGTTVFSSAVRSIPENQFRAARVDGASEWEIVRNIILPNLRFHITFITLWETLGLLTNYVTIMLITNGGPGVQTEVWALSAYHKAFADSQYGYGAAISLVLIAVVMVLMLVIGAVMRHQEKSRS